MVINKPLRKELVKFLPKNYRAEVVARLKKKGITIHPNTVGNVLNGSENKVVALEILKLSNEEKASQEEFANAIVQQSA